MTDYKPPCQAAADPNDWFIEKDGRQYNDEPVLSGLEIEEIIEENGPDEGDILDAVDRATEQRLKENLVKRRHAKDKCFTECYIRTQCLSIALESEQPPTHGIWGGYAMEEIRQIRAERDARAARRRPGVD